MNNETERAWAAGFFDGEGSVGRHKNGKKFRVQVQVAQSDPEVLYRFLAVVQIGKVRGPYGPYRTQSKPYYQYEAHNKEQARQVFTRLEPYLSSIKRKAFQEALS